MILKAVARQDNDAFSALMRMHQGKIRAYLVRLCKNYDLADDMAQETFLTALRKLLSFKGTGNFSAWLVSIAHNCFLQHIRETKRRTEITQQFGVQHEIHADRYEKIPTEQIDLELALTTLNPNEPLPSHCVTASVSRIKKYPISWQCL